jgi:hypothetical protein
MAGCETFNAAAAAVNVRFLIMALKTSSWRAFIDMVQLPPEHNRRFELEKHQALDKENPAMDLRHR